MKITENFNLSTATTFHIPAVAKVYAEYDNIDELRQLLTNPLYANMERLSIGGGSNMLFTKPFDGLILHSTMHTLKVIAEDENHVLVKAGAGVKWDDFVKYCVDHNLYGAENLSYIPGEAGASAIQNVGAYGVEAKDIIAEVSTFDPITMTERLYTQEECHFGYRDSIFKHDATARRLIVTDVTYRLSTVPRFTLGYGPLRELSGKPGLTLQEVRDRVIAIRRGKLPEPDELGSAGSFFKNPVIPKSHFCKLRETYPDIPSYPTGEGMIKVPAAWLIETSGMKGAKVGGAEVYNKQCLVIVNTGTASAADIIGLSDEIMGAVESRFSIKLTPEVNII